MLMYNNYYCSFCIAIGFEEYRNCELIALKMVEFYNQDQTFCSRKVDLSKVVSAAKGINNNVLAKTLHYSRFHRLKNYYWQAIKK